MTKRIRGAAPWGPYTIIEIPAATEAWVILCPVIPRFDRFIICTCNKRESLLTRVKSSPKSFICWVRVESESLNSATQAGLGSIALPTSQLTIYWNIAKCIATFLCNNQKRQTPYSALYIYCRRKHRMLSVLALIIIFVFILHYNNYY